MSMHAPALTGMVYAHRAWPSLAIALQLEGRAITAYFAHRESNSAEANKTKRDMRYCRTRGKLTTSIKMLFYRCTQH